MSAAPAISYPYHRECVTVLLVSSKDEDCASLQSVLQHSNWRLLVTRDCRSAMAILRRETIPVVICECRLPDGTWQSLFEETGKLPHPPRFIVSSRLADDALWGEVLNLGGYDVFPTPFEPQEVFRVVYLACCSWKQRYGAERSTPKLVSSEGISQVPLSTAASK